VLRSLAQEIRFHGDSVRARKVLERVLASYSSQPESLSKPAFRNGQAQTLFLLERFSEAKPLFESMLAENTRRPPELVARVGIIAARTGDRAGALRASDELAKRSTDYHRREFTFWRAHIMAQLGDTAQAIQLLKDAFAQGISPTSAHADMLLEPLYGNPAYEALVRPKG